MNMLLSLSIWLALMMSSCCDLGAAGSQEEESVNEYEDYYTWTATPDYDYNATFDYFYVTGSYEPDVENKATGIGPLTSVLLLGLAVQQIWN